MPPFNKNIRNSNKPDHGDQGYFDHTPSQTGLGKTSSQRLGPGNGKGQDKAPNPFKPLPVQLPCEAWRNPHLPELPDDCDGVIEVPDNTPDPVYSVPDAGAFHLISLVLFGAVVIARRTARK
jgi:hypothetical protein